MTLSTSVRFIGEPPISMQEFFLVGRLVADIPAEWPFSVSKEGDIFHQPGCPGAVCRVDYFSAEIYHGDEDEIDSPAHIRFDTPYGYRDEEGRDCDQLHALIINRLLDHAEARGWSIEWQDEYHGTWHQHHPLDTIVVGGQ